MIGEFEYLILASSLRLADEAYGASLRREIAEVTGSECSIGALYTTLDRLQAKGLLTTWMGEPTDVRGGRAKRMVAITPQGREAAATFYRTVKRASRGIAWEPK